MQQNYSISSFNLSFRIVAITYVIVLGPNALMDQFIPKPQSTPYTPESPTQIDSRPYSQQSNGSSTSESEKSDNSKYET